MADEVKSRKSVTIVTAERKAPETLSPVAGRRPKVMGIVAEEDEVTPRKKKTSVANGAYSEDTKAVKAESCENGASDASSNEKLMLEMKKADQVGVSESVDENLPKSQKRKLKKRKQMEFMVDLMESTERIREERAAKRKAMNAGGDSASSDCECPVKRKRSEPDSELPPEEIDRLKAQYRELRKKRMELPKVFVARGCSDACLTTRDGELRPEMELEPIIMDDVQSLFLRGCLKNSHTEPRWCRLVRLGKLARVVLVLVTGATVDHFRSSEKIRERIHSWTQIQVEVIGPHRYGSTALDDLCEENVSECLKKRLFNGAGFARHRRTGDAKEALSKMFPTIRRQEPEEVVGEEEKRAVEEEKPSVQEEEEPIVQEEKKPSVQEEKEPIVQEEKKPIVQEEKRAVEEEELACRKTDLLLSTQQMIEEGVVLPPHGGNGFKFTKSNYKPVSDSSPMFAVDCEMCITLRGESELTSVSIVDEAHNTLLHTLVKPRLPITNYLTQYSGITRAMMKYVTVRIEDVQKKFDKLLPPDAILVGHSIGNDLKALKLYHPYLIDTSVVFNMTGTRWRKTKLKTLSALYLGEEIQTAGDAGHDPTEDALASLKLAQLKLGNDLKFGDEALDVAVLKEMKASRKAMETCVEKPMPALSFKELSKCVAMKRSVVTLLVQERRKVLVLGSETFASRFRDPLEQLELPRTVDVVVTECGKRVAALGEASVKNFDVSFINLTYDDDRDDAEARLRKRLGRIHRGCDAGDMFLVVFGGSEASNAACFVGIKD